MENLPERKGMHWKRLKIHENHTSVSRNVVTFRSCKLKASERASKGIGVSNQSRVDNQNNEKQLLPVYINKEESTIFIQSKGCQKPSKTGALWQAGFFLGFRQRWWQCSSRPSRHSTMTVCSWRSSPPWPQVANVTNWLSCSKQFNLMAENEIGCMIWWYDLNKCVFAQ